MQLLTTVAFWVSRFLLVLTAVDAALAAWRHRDTHRLNILAVVAWLAIFPLIGHRQAPAVHVIAAAMLFVQPYFLLRLVRHFRRVPMALLRGAVGTIVAGTALSMLVPANSRGFFVLAPIYVALVQVYAAVAFSQEAARTSGVTKKRLAYAAVGTWMFVSPYLWAGFATAVPLSLTAARLTLQVNELLEAGVLICYFFAFNTPRRLRSNWQRAEQARYLSETADRDVEERGRRAAEDLNRAAARSAGNSLTLVALRPDPASADLVVTAASDATLTGVRVGVGAGLIGRAIDTRTALSGSLADWPSDIGPRLSAAGTYVLIAPIVTSTRTWGVVLVVQRHGSLFPDDDLRLLEQLGRYAGTALDHANLVAESRERERHAAAARLHETESRMELMLDSIKDYAMFVLDADGLVSTWHIGAEHVFGYQSEEMLHEPAATLYDMTRADFQALLDEARRFGRADQESPCRRRDGGRFVGATIIRPLKGEANALQGFVAVTRDVTERRELEDRLRQSQKMEAIGQLAGGIAHDFNNLLTAILGYADWLGRDARGRSAGGAGNRRDSRRRPNARPSLTRQLLAFSRRKMLQPTRHRSVAPRAADLLPMLRRLIGEHVQIAFEPAPDEPLAVLGDRSQIEQVIVNLAVNARDAMPDGGRLTIRTAHVRLDAATGAGERGGRAYVMLEVTDTGIGMDADDAVRASSSRSSRPRSGNGTGLGLATVYGIVKQMGGAIRVQSEVGTGTSFRLYFPETRAREVAVAPAASTGAGLARHRDDSPRRR